MEDEQFDGLFYNVMNQARGIDGFFEKCFGFFRRKTDFFAAPDKAFKAIEVNFQLNAKKYQDLKEKEEKKKKKQEDEKKKKDLEEELRRREEATKAGKVPTPTTENKGAKSSAEPSVVEITPEEYERRKKQEQEGSSSSNPSQSAVEHTIPQKSTVSTQPSSTIEVSAGNANTTLNAEGLPYRNPEKNSSIIEPNHPCLRTEYGVSLIKEVWADEHGLTFIMPDRNHGGRMEKYSWGQPRVEENWISIPINPAIKGKEVKVNADSSRLVVTLRGEEYLNREFLKKINASTFMWIIDENKELGKFIHITFEKLERMSWWESTFKGDPKIDCKKINPEASRLSDCDESMRPQIEKAMYDTRQKAMGLPTSDEMGGKNYDAFQKFMKAHPEMDFSKAKFQ